jgi:hypothetical protein
MTRVGALLIGSLFWERQRWPSDDLDFDAARTVPAPIRYGRVSQKRDNGYTMVLSPRARAGSAKLVPFRQRAAGIDDLLQLAHGMAHAEGLRDQLSVRWGCVGLLERSEGSAIVRGWRARMKGRTGHIAAAFGEEEPALDRDGVIPTALWPGEGAEDLDVVLVAVTCPTPPAPTPEDIADAMGVPPAGTKGFTYFVQNRSHGITTFQDEQILAALESRGFRL